MVMRIEFKNFRCLRDTSLDLTPLTVIVGPNASGKSSILQALDPGFAPAVDDIYQRVSGKKVQVARIDDRGEANVSVRDSNGQGGNIDSRLQYGYQLLRLDVNALRRPNQVVPAYALAVTGENLTNVFDTLDRETQAELVKQFCTLVPVFADVNAKPTGSGNKHLVFKDRWNNAAEYSPQQVSDGSMLVFAFLILRYQKQSPDVLAVEELERGLHPYLIGELVSFLRRMAMGEFGGKRMGVVIATHSPQVLSCIQPAELRVLTRHDDGSVEIIGLSNDEKDLRRALEEYEGSLGGLWLSGNLGGVPGAA